MFIIHKWTKINVGIGSLTELDNSTLIYAFKLPLRVGGLSTHANYLGSKPYHQNKDRCFIDTCSNHTFF